MPMFYKNGSTWKEVLGFFYKNGSLWKEVINAWYKDGAVWKLFYERDAGGTTSMSWGGIAATTFDAAASAFLSIRRDGDVTINSNGITGGVPGANDWITPRDSSVGDDWHVRLVTLSGPGPSGDSALSAGVWYALTNDRTWTWTQTTIGTRLSSHRLELSNDGGSNVERSHTFDVTVVHDTIGGGF